MLDHEATTTEKEPTVIHAIILRVDGTHEVTDIEPGLDGLYGAIGHGCDNVDVIDFPEVPSEPGGATLWLDGEGLFRVHGVNEFAQRLYAWHTGARPQDVAIVNDVVITGGTDAEGDTTSLTDAGVIDVLHCLGLPLPQDA